MPNDRSRLDRARLRATGAKRVLATAAAASFVVALFVARASHPAQAATRSHASGRSSASQAGRTDGGFNFGIGSVTSSGGSTPQVQTNVS